jgi:hypothetical protein
MKFKDRRDAGRQLVKPYTGIPMPVVYEKAGGSIEYFVLALDFSESLELEEKLNDGGRNGCSL